MTTSEISLDAQVAEVRRTFLSFDWEADLHSADAFTMRAGPLTIDYDGSLPHPFGVELEFAGIPPFDFRALSAAEARNMLMGLRDGLSNLWCLR